MAVASFIGKHDYPGQRFVFCEEIGANPIITVMNANLVSRAFGDRKIIVFSSPSNLSSGIDESEEQSQVLGQAEVLANLIQGLVLDVEKEAGKIRASVHTPCVCLFVHNQGAVVAKACLKLLVAADQEPGKPVRVYAFGGTTLIPNRLADKVSNYINNRVNCLGNKYFDEKSGEAFNKITRIKHIIKEKNCDLESAILEQTRSDLRTKLGSINWIDLINLFRSENLEKNEMFIEIKQSYNKCFSNYNIVFTSLTGFRSSSKALGKLIEGCEKSLVSYLSAIKEIAKEEAFQPISDGASVG